MSYRRADYQIHLTGPFMASKLLLLPGHRVIGATYNPVRDTVEFVIAEGERPAGADVGEGASAPVRDGDPTP